MNGNPHISVQLKRGVKIILCDPATKRIEAETRNGETIAINAYYQNPAFRWPKAGETWMVKEENGSWYLDGIWEPQEESEPNFANFECPGSQYAVGTIVRHNGKLWKKT